MCAHSADRQPRPTARPAAVAVIVIVSLGMLLGFLALAVDISYLWTARTEMQSAVDASALAAVNTLLSEERLKGSAALLALMERARTAAAQYAAANTVLGASLSVDANPDNQPAGDILIGHLADPADRTTPLDLSDPLRFNAVFVRLRHDETRNGSLGLMFARLLGHDSAPVVVQATATFEDGVVGFRIPPSGESPSLLPLALHQDPWRALLAGGVTGANDNYTYDPATGAVCAGPDGLPELNLYPGSGAGQLPPGNFGTVDIGSPSNSTADLSRQIRYGLNAEDLSYFGGELKLGPDGTLLLNGDTGLSAAIKDDLEFIKGKARSIPLFDQVAGPGNNATYRVVGFAGIRIVHVKLTGSMNSKQVIIQPAVVVDGGAVTDPSGGSSYHVYRPVVLCR